MSATCERWNDAVNASDAFQLMHLIRFAENVKFTVGGVTTPPSDDNSDILIPREITARAFDLLDDPTTR